MSTGALPPVMLPRHDCGHDPPVQQTRVDRRNHQIRVKPRILFVINSLCGGGAERVMSTLLRHSAFKKEYFELHLALLDKEFSAYPVPTWVTLHQLNCRFSLVRSIIELRRLVAAIDPVCV